MKDLKQLQNDLDDARAERRRLEDEVDRLEDEISELEEEIEKHRRGAMRQPDLLTRFTPLKFVTGAFHDLFERCCHGESADEEDWDTLRDYIEMREREAS